MAFSEKFIEIIFVGWKGKVSEESKCEFGVAAAADFARQQLNLIAAACARAALRIIEKPLQIVRQTRKSPANIFVYPILLSTYDNTH